MWGVRVTDNILGAVLDEIRHDASQVLKEAGELYKRVAYDACPVSEVNTPGYVHLRDTIGYEADTDSLAAMQFVVFYVTKSYAQFVNDGTSRMRPRPFFDTGMLAVQDGLDALAEQQFRMLQLGHLAARGR